jgi:hypothetical protein
VQNPQSVQLRPVFAGHQSATSSVGNNRARTDDIICAKHAFHQLDSVHMLQTMQARQLAPHAHAFNSLINATGRAFRLGDVAGLVRGAFHLPFRPSAVHHSCH